LGRVKLLDKNRNEKTVQNFNGKLQLFYRNNNFLNKYGGRITDCKPDRYSTVLACPPTGGINSRVISY